MWGRESVGGRETERECGDGERLEVLRENERVRGSVERDREGVWKEGKSEREREGEGEREGEQERRER